MLAFPSDRTVISPPKHSDASWAESKDFTSASLNRYLWRADVLEELLQLHAGPTGPHTHHLLFLYAWGLTMSLMKL